MLSCLQFYPERQKLTLKGDKTALKDETLLQAAGVSEGGELGVKDLGPQISWRTVFLVEYVSPLCITPSRTEIGLGRTFDYSSSLLSFS